MTYFETIITMLIMLGGILIFIGLSWIRQSHKESFCEGYMAYVLNKSLQDNPYSPTTNRINFFNWVAGWELSKKIRTKSSLDPSFL
jgi:hypothetical protein